MEETRQQLHEYAAVRSLKSVSGTNPRLLRKLRKYVQVILFEIDCSIFYTNLHELFCQSIS